MAFQSCIASKDGDEKEKKEEKKKSKENPCVSAEPLVDIIASIDGSE